MTVYETAVEELTARNIYPFAPLGVNFAIGLGWFLARKIFKASKDYQTAQQAEEEGGTGVFLSVEVILYLFSFLVTLAVFLTLDFWFKVKDVGQFQYMWWLPSAVTIGLAEIAKGLEILTQKKPAEGELTREETELEKRTQHFTYYFWITVLTLGGFWIYLLFGDSPDLIFDLFAAVNTFFL